MTNEEILAEACDGAKTRLDAVYLEKINKMEQPAISKREKIKIYNYIANLDNKINDNLKEYKPKRATKRTLKAILIAAILLLLFAISSFAFSPVRNFFIKVYNDCSEIVFNISNEEDYLYSEYEYIPEGYKLVSDQKLKNGQMCIYENHGKRIIIDSGYTENSALVIDTENSTTMDINHNDIVGYYSQTEKSNILVWSIGKCYHCITADISEEISLDELLKIAESRIQAK